MRACLLVLRTPLSLLAAFVPPSVPIRLSPFLPLCDPSSPFLSSFRHIPVGVRSFFVTYLSVCITQSVPPCCWWKLMCTHMHAHPRTCRGVLPIAFAINTFSPTSCFSLQEFSSGNIQSAEWFLLTHSACLSSPKDHYKSNWQQWQFRNNTVWVNAAFTWYWNYCKYKISSREFSMNGLLSQFSMILKSIRQQST